MSKSLLIIGCGFIGKYFLNHFADSFDEITTTSTRSIPHTKSKTHISFNMYDSNIPHFPKSDINLITLPFSRQLRTPTDYTNAIETISKRIPQSSKVIFTSSTGIYPFLDTWVDETSATDTTSRARALEKCENNLLSAFKTCHILRLAGICGYERNSHTKLSKKIICDANLPVNLIHVDDIILFIMQLIENDYKSDIINISSTDHPTKEAYYTYLCSQFKTQKPEFQNSNTPFKLVCNKKLREKYGFTFKYNSPLGFKFS